MTWKLGIQHRVLKHNQICLNDAGLTLTIFLTWSNLFPNASAWVKSYAAYCHVFPSSFQFSISYAHRWAIQNLWSSGFKWFVFFFLFSFSFFFHSLSFVLAFSNPPIRNNVCDTVKHPMTYYCWWLYFRTICRICWTIASSKEKHASNTTGADLDKPPSQRHLTAGLINLWPMQTLLFVLRRTEKFPVTN